MPPRFISWPARMKNGIASRAKLSSPVAIRWAMTVVAAGGSSDINNAATAAVPIVKEMGTPASNRRTNTTPRMKASFISIQRGRLLCDLGLAAKRFNEKNQGVKRDEHAGQGH